MLWLSYILIFVIISLICSRRLFFVIIIIFDFIFIIFDDGWHSKWKSSLIFILLLWLLRRNFISHYWRHTKCKWLWLSFLSLNYFCLSYRLCIFLKGIWIIFNKRREIKLLEDIWSAIWLIRIILFNFELDLFLFFRYNWKRRFILISQLW